MVKKLKLLVMEEMTDGLRLLGISRENRGASSRGHLEKESIGLEELENKKKATQCVTVTLVWSPVALGNGSRRVTMSLWEALELL